MYCVIFFLVSFFLTYLIKNYAIKKSMLATVNERSSHSLPTPHGGGIAIAITWAIGLFYLYFTKNIDEKLFFAFLIGFIISIVSFFDDIYELSPKLRLIVQSLVAIVSLVVIGGFNNLNFGLFFIENQIITNLFAFFMIIWFVNLTNFIDGINGYVGSEFVFLSTAGFLFFNSPYFLVLAVSVLGFLFWNYNKAKIFMGDVGSTLLGFNIAIITIYHSNTDSSNFWLWIILFTPFWFDATITLIRRKINGEKLSQAHKKHAYQRLTQSGWSHFKVTNYLILLNLIILLTVYIIKNILFNIIIVFLLILAIYLYIENKKAFEK